MAGYGAKLTQIVRRYPLGSAAVFLLAIGIAFELLWLIVVVLIVAGSIAWLRFDQRRQVEAWVEDEGLGREALAQHASSRSAEELVPELSLKALGHFRARGRALLRERGPRTRSSASSPVGRSWPGASKPTGEELAQPSGKDLRSHRDVHRFSGGERDSTSDRGSAHARHEPDQPDGHETDATDGWDERASAPPSSGEAVRTRLERPLSGLRDASKTRRGLVFRS